MISALVRKTYTTQLYDGVILNGIYSEESISWDIMDNVQRMPLGTT